MQTVDLLLEKGADVTAINWEGATPANMADDKDLKTVLKQLTKAVEKKAPGYSGSPQEEDGVRQEDGGGGGQEEYHCQVQQPCGGQEPRVVEEDES